MISRFGSTRYFSGRLMQPGVFCSRSSLAGYCKFYDEILEVPDHRVPKYLNFSVLLHSVTFPSRPDSQNQSEGRRFHSYEVIRMDFNNVQGKAIPGQVSMRLRFPDLKTINT